MTDSSTSSKFSHTNPKTKFTPFTLNTPSGRGVTGIEFVPGSAKSTTEDIKPLIVALHGATCFSGYWDLDEEHTASLAASALGLPFVAIDRPGYVGTDSVDLDGSTYQLATARWIQDEILPELWQKYGVPNGCSAVCLMCHSLGCCVGITIASLHARAITKAQYPLAGLIISGVGSRLRRSASVVENPAELDINILPPVLQRDLSEQVPLMLGDPELELYNKAISSSLASQAGSMTREELHGGIMFMVTEAGIPFVESVQCSVLYSLAEHDHAGYCTQEEARNYAGMFKNSRRVDWSLVRNAPHAIEWSRAGKGWYFHCMGWALEVTADYVIRQQQ
ncbi:hypothetical protein HII31_00246 [Pseudocercospora fuligena]|uniref:AB hydrolase-1 domain-containing protein n=1 Tax=Pseudocercospora fuligena TaxID=685502 RepID=A0A8H6VQ60_9PEZI|nr:hypothetical protein HII31_00246 [Pseudocercospora fuligena]